MDISKLSHRAYTVGSLPLIRYIVDRLNLDELLERYVPKKRLGRGADLPSGQAISALIFNVLISREPLYAVPEWLRAHSLDLIGLKPSECDRLNDDRIGRALDQLYELEPASLLTAVLTKAVKEFDIQASQIHNDTTSIAFFGDYEGQRDPAQKKEPPFITFGHSKDHRPDLKQLVYSLSITSDNGFGYANVSVRGISSATDPAVQRQPGPVDRRDAYQTVYEAAQP